MAHGEGYWISPTGRVVTVDRHINAVINKPASFGMTHEYLKSLYAKHGETVGVEGKAREQILRDAMRNGWIRVREWRGRQGEFITVEANKINNKVIDLIQQFADAYVKGEVPGAYPSEKARGLMDVTVNGLTDGFRKRYNMKQLAEFAMFSQYETDDSEYGPLEYVGHYKDLSEEQIRSLTSIEDARTALRRILGEPLPTQQEIFAYLRKNGIGEAVGIGLVKPLSVTQASTVTEASISRFMRHVEEGGPGFAIMSGDRPTEEDLTRMNRDPEDAERTPEENREFYERLKKLVKEKGYGYVRVKGGYRDKESGVVSYENSLFVPDISEEAAKAFAKFLGKDPWNQESILWGNKDGVYLLFGSGDQMELGPFRPKQIGDYFTEWRKRRFTFEESLDFWYEDRPWGQISGLTFLANIAKAEVGE